MFISQFWGKKDVLSIKKMTSIGIVLGTVVSFAVEDTSLVAGTVLVGTDLVQIAVEDTFLVVGTVPEAFDLEDNLVAFDVEGTDQECIVEEPWVVVLDKLLVDWCGD